MEGIKEGEEEKQNLKSPSFLQFVQSGWRPGAFDLCPTVVNVGGTLSGNYAAVRRLVACQRGSALIKHLPLPQQPNANDNRAEHRDAVTPSVSLSRLNFLFMQPGSSLFPSSAAKSPLTMDFVTVRAFNKHTRLCGCVCVCVRTSIRQGENCSLPSANKHEAEKMEMYLEKIPQQRLSSGVAAQSDSVPNQSSVAAPPADNFR